MVDGLLQGLDSSESLVRADARAQLLALGTDAVEPLIGAMEHGNIRLAWQAAIVLGEIPDARWMEPMCRALRSNNILLGQTAVECLEKALHTDAVEIFLATLPHCRTVVQIALINALERLRDKRSIMLLNHLLETTVNPELRYNIIQALGAIGDNTSIALIRKFQNDANRHVRERVESALASLDSQQ
jgi:HEAT repeat protein